MKYIVKIWAIISFIIIIFAIIFIFAFIFFKGFRSINMNFIFSNPAGIILGKEGGIFPAIVGSIYTSFISCIISSIFGISSAIYLVFYNKNKFINSIFDIIFQCIAGIPSIVLGLFGYYVLVLYMGFGKSILSMSITQSIMILPFISIRVKKALNEFDFNIIYSSYSLGIRKSYTIRKIVLKEALTDIISIITLANSLSIGATAPLIFTGAVINSPVPNSIFKPSMVLPYHLYILLTQEISENNAYATAFILLSIVLMLNLISLFLKLINNKKYKTDSDNE